MSSDIFSRPVDVSKFGLIYAGAQKNMGPAGATLVIVKNDLLGKVDRKLPSMLDYKVHIDNDSMYNTPPAFAVYVCMLTLQWLKDLGGVTVMDSLNQEKSDYFYNALDNNPAFRGTIAKEDRSRMNACFLLNDESRTDEFMQKAKEAGIVGIKGHRLSGGFRASLYNALPLESVKVLTEIMGQFSI
jgi:phosphoserine aminotransferase